MELEEAREAELQELVERLDRLVPKDGAHLTIPGEPHGRTTVGSRLGYLRFGIEFLAAALRPLAGTELEPARIEPEIDYLLTQGSEAPFDLCEIDEAIGSRAPVRSGLGPFGQLAAGVLVVAALILIFVGGSVVLRWLFG
ncbi:MAG TPA: hypothetical protein VGN09_29600 [Vicinamibacteria bacterium]